MGGHETYLDSESNLHGMTAGYCQLIRLGGKLVAEVTFDQKSLPVVKDAIAEEKCQAIFTEVDGYERITAWIYKYPFVADLIKEWFLADPERMPTAFSIWATGKLFGYSDREIESYLIKHGICG
jgi:hypothetical protein